MSKCPELTETMAKDLMQSLRNIFLSTDNILVFVMKSIPAPQYLLNTFVIIVKELLNLRNLSKMI